MPVQVYDNDDTIEVTMFAISRWRKNTIRFRCGCAKRRCQSMDNVSKVIWDTMWENDVSFLGIMVCRCCYFERLPAFEMMGRQHES